MSKVIIFKNITELDLLNHDEIMAYRRDILRNDIFDWKIYIEELELYMDIRFKEKVMMGFDSYREKANNPKTDAWEKSAAALIIKLQPDNESLYSFFTDGKLKLLYPYKYITLELLNYKPSFYETPKNNNEL
jgi:hypothetical protein